MLIAMSKIKYDSSAIEDKESKSQNNVDEADHQTNNQEEEEEEEDIARSKTGKTETPWLTNKKHKKDKSNMKFFFFCILVILIAYPLFGLSIYFVQEGRKVKC